MAAKGTGFQPGAEARKIKQQALQDKKARLKAITDSGRTDTMFQRQFKAMRAKEGIDVNDDRDKFTILKEKKETEKLVKMCIRKFQKRKKKEVRKPIEEQ